MWCLRILYVMSYVCTHIYMRSVCTCPEFFSVKSKHKVYRFCDRISLTNLSRTITESYQRILVRIAVRQHMITIEIKETSGLP